MRAVVTGGYYLAEVLVGGLLEVGHLEALVEDHREVGPLLKEQVKRQKNKAKTWMSLY